MNKSFNIRIISLVAILIVGGFWLFKNFQISKWTADKSNHQVISHDIKGYYGYLPALFIKGDLSLAFKDDPSTKNPIKWSHASKAPDGNGYIMKMSMGCAFLYLPFFLLAHGFALITPYAADGFSVPYDFAIAMATVAYGLAGIWLMVKILRPYFNPWIIGLTVLAIGIGTNLFAYITIKAGMTHAYSFFLFNLYLLVLFRILERPLLKTGFIFGLIGGLIILIRPTNIIPVVLLPLLLGVVKPKLFKDRLVYLFSNYRMLFLIIGGALLVCLPQLLYWKWLSGDWLYFSYNEEGFFFDRFLIYEVLFSFRKGWLIYTPMMVFSLVGLFFLRDSLKKFLPPLVAILPVMIYIFGAWWCWWFGGAFGYRSMIDYYGLLAVPMAATFQKLMRFKVSSILTIAVIAFLIHLNIYQTRQYRIAILHWDSMTKEAYWEVFLNNDTPDNYDELLYAPDYDKALKGDPQSPRHEKNEK